MGIGTSKTSTFGHGKTTNRNSPVITFIIDGKNMTTKAKKVDTGFKRREYQSRVPQLDSF